MLTTSAEEQEQSHLTPCSIVRHRSHNTAGQTERRVTQPAVQRASRVRRTTDSHPSRDYETFVSSGKTNGLAETSQRHKHRRMYAHPLVYIGLGMVAMLTLWVGLSLALGWSQTLLDDLRYGRPRTYQTDAWVGHNEQNGSPSHFIALNLNRHIQVIEIQGNDPAHTRIYSGPQLYGAGDDLAPVTLRFLDVNGDHRSDMIVTFQGSRIVYINESGGFRLARSAEQPQIEHALQNQ